VDRDGLNVSVEQRTGAVGVPAVLVPGAVARGALVLMARHHADDRRLAITLIDQDVARRPVPGDGVLAHEVPVGRSPLELAAESSHHKNRSFDVLEHLERELLDIGVRDRGEHLSELLLELRRLPQESLVQAGHLAVRLPTALLDLALDREVDELLDDVLAAVAQDRHAVRVDGLRKVADGRRETRSRLGRLRRHGTDDAVTRALEPGKDVGDNRNGDPHHNLTPRRRRDDDMTVRRRLATHLDDGTWLRPEMTRAGSKSVHSHTPCLRGQKAKELKNIHDIGLIVNGWQGGLGVSVGHAVHAQAASLRAPFQQRHTRLRGCPSWPLPGAHHATERVA